MDPWSPQLFKRHAAKQGVDPTVVANALEVAAALQKKSPKLPPVFSLRHLAHISGVDYGFLRAVIGRKAAPNDYRIFRIHKRSSSPDGRRYRVIAVPSPDLLKVQRWITQEILSRASAHPASVAFSKGNRLVDAASPHCECKWLIKLDVRSFFESINEIAVYRVFESLGYQPLMAFELTRLCTRMPYPESSVYRRARSRMAQWRINQWEWDVVKAYQVWPDPVMGHLPQGAPSSPMLSNLTMIKLDEKISSIAGAHGLIYTRYADDISLSSQRNDIDHALCRQVIGKVYRAIGEFGLSPNSAKTSISGPGARKVVLGLLVDGEVPRLTRAFRMMVRQHLHYLKEFGVTEHSAKRGFVSTIGFRNHMLGLVAYAAQIDSTYAASIRNELAEVDWSS